jgi:predicted AlkP superfamily phosphohydrolase/phosphomutase
MESYLRFNAIDWERTRAFADENPHYPQIWLNVQGREPKGIVSPGAEYESVRAAVAERLLAWKDPTTGQPVVNRVYRREDVYSGAHVDKAPDLSIDWNLTGGYSYVPRLSRPRAGAEPIRRLRPSEREGVTSGSHRDHGIAAFFGDGVRAGATPARARIVDIAPTLLYLLGLPVPEDMDGTVLAEVLADDLVKGQPITYSNADDPGNGRSEEGYTGEDAVVIEERLRGLGYIE